MKRNLLAYAAAATLALTPVGALAQHVDGHGERHHDHHDDHHEVVREHHHHDDDHGGERRTTVIERH